MNQISEVKRFALLGSTGSIGKSTLAVARANQDSMKPVLLAAKKNWKLLAEQALEFKPEHVVIEDTTHFQELRDAVHSVCECHCGREALCSLMEMEGLDIVLCAIVGTGGLFPTLTAIHAGKDIALASKEVMVMAGELVTNAAKSSKIRILPVDSEHSAIFQCLESRHSEEIQNLILTASGGPFRKSSLEEMSNMNWEQALKHPTWSMGPKVTIDSASLMNKALEIIEARWLFNVTEENIEVVIHPQSIVHSMIRFKDGSLLAQMSKPDMRFPIQYALTWPIHKKTNLPELDLTEIGSLTFEKPDETKFPSLRYARTALRTGGALPAILNAANESAFLRFRHAEIRFTDIWKIVEKTMDLFPNAGELHTLNEILAADTEARAKALEITV